MFLLMFKTLLNVSLITHIETLAYLFMHIRREENLCTLHKQFSTKPLIQIDWINADVFLHLYIFSWMCTCILSRNHSSLLLLAFLGHYRNGIDTNHVNHMYNDRGCSAGFTEFGHSKLWELAQSLNGSLAIRSISFYSEKYTLRQQLLFTNCYQKAHWLIRLKELMWY